MKFQSKIDETIFVSEIMPERSYMFRQDLKTGISIIWNTGAKASFTIDGQVLELEKDHVIFLTEFHKIDTFTFERMNVIQFNRSFHCVEEDDSEIGCKGILFFGAAGIPQIAIPKESKRQFELMWEMFLMEMEENDLLKLEMLRAMLKRFLIICLRVYKNQNKNLPADNVSVGIIGEYNYLVEKYFKKYTTVADYARLLHKAPKTLANVFKMYIDKTPVEIINDRRLLEAKRLLQYSAKTVNEIADEVNFADAQAFSQFFKKHAGISPTTFRKHK